MCIPASYKYDKTTNKDRVEVGIREFLNTFIVTNIETLNNDSVTSGKSQSRIILNITLKENACVF